MTSPNWANRTMWPGENLDISEKDALAAAVGIEFGGRSLVKTLAAFD